MGHARFRRAFGALGVCGLSLIAFALTTAVGAATPNVGTTPFTDSGGRISFQVPADWQSRASSVLGGASASGGVEIVGSWQATNPQGAFNVTTSDIPARTTLDAYVKVQIADAKKTFPDATIDSTATQSLTLGGQPARRLDYTGTPKEPPGAPLLRWVNIMVLQNNVAYILTFAALPANFDAFMASAPVVLDSFAFLKPTVASSQPTSLAYRIGYALAPVIFVGIPTLIIISVVQANKRKRAQRAQPLPAAAPYGPGAYPPPASQFAPGSFPVDAFGFSGGPGDAPYRAVIITGARSAGAGAKAEHQYLAQQFGPPAGASAPGSPGWTVLGQMLVPQDGRQYDVLSVSLPDGTRRDIWFDVSSFV